VKRLALAGLVVLAACGSGGGDSDGEPRRLPAMELAALDTGEPALALGDLRGPAVVNLWATWCAPCREELPAFQEVAAARPDVRFVGVNSQETGAAREYLDELGITYEQVVDRRGELAEALGAVGLPVTVVIDGAGAITTEHLGPMSAADLEEALAEAG
jgi:thiol-disulfide isomerase/thioredoxin